MSEQVIVPATEETVTEPQKVGAESQPIQEKKFSQAELEHHLKARLEKEKESHKKVLEAKESEVASMKMSLETSDLVLEKYKGTVKKLISKQIEGLPASIKEILAKLDPDEQVEWLDKNASQFSVRGIPAVPDGKTPGATMDELIQKKKASGIY